MDESNQPYYTYDLSGDVWLPKGWSEMLAYYLFKHGFDLMPGVKLLKGEKAMLYAPYMGVLYRQRVLPLVQELFGSDIVSSPDVETAVFINGILPGSAYERHLDTNPITAVLMGSYHLEGGELAFNYLGEEVKVRPEVGSLVIFEGAKYEHWVTPTTSLHMRVSVAMNFYHRDDTPVDFIKLRNG